MKSESELKVTEELIVKYLSGEGTPEEAIAINDWLQVEENKGQFEGLQSVWNAAHPSKKVRTSNQAEAWKKLEPVVTQAKGRRRFMRLSSASIGIAATLVLAVVAGLLYFSRKPSSDLSVLLTTDSTRNITLADDSRITMYHNTGIAIPKKFEGNAREITLVNGEAYFSVAKNESKPFIIHAGFANIRVLGTEFNVVVNNDEVIVGVDEGKVMFYTALDSVLIEKGMAASMKPAKSAETVNMSSNTWAYATRKLVFKDTPMNEVIDVVQKTYGRTVRLSNDNIKNCTLNATFDNDPLEKVVHLIAETLNLKLEKDGQAFILDGDGKSCH
jgi:ferric-dicitrate binding protein FerR (iron transport regulator)